MATYAADPTKPKQAIASHVPGDAGMSYTTMAGGPQAIAPPQAFTPPPAVPMTTPPPARNNFSWGVHGKGTEGVDFGNTQSWDEAKWQQYEREHGITPAAAPPAPSGPAAPAAPAAPITTAQGVTGSTATVGGGAAQGAPTTVAQSFQQALINRMNPGAAGAGAPSIAPAIQANQLAEQRGFERNRNLLAERAAATGTNNSGGFESQLLGLAQDRAQREGQFEGDAVQREQERLDRNQSGALGMAGSMLTGQQGFGLQEQLANLDAQLRREGIGAQTALGNRDLDLRGRLGEGQLNLGLLSALMNNDQFGRSLGQNASQFGAGLDQQGILGLLGLL